MGDQQISPLSSQSKKDFLRNLLCDIESLESMIDNGTIETGVTRIGAEQEFCLVNKDLRPAMTGSRLLKQLNEPHFTPELAQWNLEINLDPQDAGPGCLARMDTQLNDLLRMAAEEAKAMESSIVLTGILPTVRKSELDFKFMSPNPRYQVLGRILKELRGEDFSLSIEGVDEINLKHNSILFEACNTSFQVHLQISPEQFADQYNWSQVLAGPVLASCANSPILLGKELWSETRIALFRQSLETRNAGNYVRDKHPRVAFGYDWLKHSAVEIFKNDIAIYKMIVGTELNGPTSAEVLADGKIPMLQAMNLHNGTIYKWNRACYGVGNGVPHLRIENRYIPAGPTPHDEMSNAAFWIGLMKAMPEKCKGNWDRFFYFQEVRSNFLKAAQHGLESGLRWFGKSIGSRELILEHLLPMAETGLQSMGIPSEEYGGYMATIEQRVTKNQTGASWIVDSLRSLRAQHTIDESILIITQAMCDNSLGARPGHEWEIPDASRLKTIPNRYDRVDSVMVTNLVTILEDDLIDFASTLMGWKSFHHLPVENAQGEMVGIISASDIERFQAAQPDELDALVEVCMTSDVLTVSPEMSLDKAEKIMRVNEFGSLPVVRDNRVVGIITVNDIRVLREKQGAE